MFCFSLFWVLLVAFPPMESYGIKSTTAIQQMHSGLGGNTYPVVQIALENGFRKFDTAEADWWYNQAEVGRSLKDYFYSASSTTNDDDRINGCTTLQISTKIPPWSLTSAADIRNHAANSRQELVGFCDVVYQKQNKEQQADHSIAVFPLDVYYIHAPRCWSGMCVLLVLACCTLGEDDIDEIVPLKLLHPSLTTSHAISMVVR
jgi:diketogulonate reductase-like aldo/keto reductase